MAKHKQDTYRGYVVYEKELLGSAGYRVKGASLWFPTYSNAMDWIDAQLDKKPA